MPETLLHIGKVQNHTGGLNWYEPWVIRVIRILLKAGSVLLLIKV